MDSKEKVEQILEILKKTYPHAKIALNFKNDWELLVAVILSAQCTDRKVNEVTAKLFQKYKTLDDYTKANLTEFEKDIHSTGFYHAKAKNILTTARLVKEKFAGKVPRTMEELTSLAGVARKTANIVLGNAFNIVVGIAVDTHVSRVSQRLALTKNTDPVKIEKDLMSLLPREEWFLFTYRIIDFGREICVAKGPFCSKCPLNRFCPSAFKIPSYR